MTVEATNCNRTYAAKAQSMEALFSSDVIDFKDMPMGAIHVLWTGITGALTGTFKIYASNLPDPSSFDVDGTEIDQAVITPHNATGSRIWIRDRLSFRYALVRYTPVGITGGLCDIIAIGKKS